MKLEKYLRTSNFNWREEVWPRGQSYKHPEARLRA